MRFCLYPLRSSNILTNDFLSVMLKYNISNVLKMKIEQKTLLRGEIELTFELTVEEYEPFLKKAAFYISENLKIAGFRAGKAP